jgi:hypothetical protein
MTASFPIAWNYFENDNDIPLSSVFPVSLKLLSSIYRNKNTSSKAASKTMSL